MRNKTIGMLHDTDGMEPGWSYQTYDIAYHVTRMRQIFILDIIIVHLSFGRMGHKTFFIDQT